MVQSIVDFLSGLKKGVFGITLVANTQPKMNKTNNPYFGRVTKVTRLTNVAIGYSYENTIKNRLERAGSENTDFKSEAPKGRHWVEGYENILLQSNKDDTQYYLRTTMRKNTKASVTYLVDNRPATDEEINEFKAFFPKSSTSNKQTEAGLQDEEQVVVRDYKLESIQSLTLGNLNYLRAK